MVAKGLRLNPDFFILYPGSIKYAVNCRIEDFYLSIRVPDVVYGDCMEKVGKLSECFIGTYDLIADPVRCRFRVTEA